MLKEIYIENLAIIEKAVISFTEGLNIFSGETGAGKSILIGGINAVLGGRTSKEIVRAGTAKANITALFDYIPDVVKQKLEEYGYTADNDELLLQREISADGKSTARICGKTATVAVLKDVAAGLIDIHGQHDNQILMSNDKQREILDSYGQLEGALEQYRSLFKDFSQLSHKIKRLQEENSLKQEKLEILEERINELNELNFREGEEAEIEQRLTEARNFEEIQTSLAIAYNCIEGSDDEAGALSLSERTCNEMGKLSDYVNGCEELRQRLESVIVELDDIKSEISSKMSDGEQYPLAYLEERMSDILRAKRKYGMDIDALIEQHENWKLEYEALLNSDDVLEALLEERHKLADTVRKNAAEISEIRKKTAEILVEKISEELKYLDMPNVKLIFAVEQDKISVNGMDRIEMLISVNKGEEPKPINKIASGGELSRIMLAIKNVLASNDNIPTMIFDEIDTGISGHAAQKVGIKLAEIAEKRQVLCVTHLAQIAAMADNHLLIRKSSDESRTYTKIYPLSFDERKKEIARIISGDSESEAALNSAEELLLRKEK